MKQIKALFKLSLHVKMRVTSLTLIIYSFAFIIPLNVLSTHLIGTMLGITVVQILVTIVAEIVRMDALLRNDDRPGKIIFIFLFVSLLIWISCFLYTIVYFSSDVVGESTLLFTRYNPTKDVAINLGYIIPTSFLIGFYFRFWYRFFWVEYVSVIFCWIRDDMHRKNE